MDIGEFLRGIRSSCEDEIREIETALGAGKCADFNAYNKRCGEITGLYKALEIISDKLKQLHMEDDDG